jgi:hypothetical protein
MECVSHLASVKSAIAHKRRDETNVPPIDYGPFKILKIFSQQKHAIWSQHPQCAIGKRTAATNASVPAHWPRKVAPAAPPAVFSSAIARSAVQRELFALRDFDLTAVL